MSFFGWLQVLFIALKLLGVISWTWFWVLFPCIVTAALLVILGILTVAVGEMESRK